MILRSLDVGYNTVNIFVIKYFFLQEILVHIVSFIEKKTYVVCLW
jgi:hypothetical protein